MEATIYNYTPIQANVVALHDQYRTALMNARYYARLLHWFKVSNLTTDIIVALAASAAFVSLAFWNNDLTAWVPAALIAVSAVISALRPVFRLSDRIDRYSKLHYGYMELYYHCCPN